MDDYIKKIVLALDVEDKETALTLVQELKDCVGMFKIGKQLFTRYGPEIVNAVLDTGGDIFLDLKFHDIPNTVAKASREAVRLGVKIFNVHTTGGSEMMERTVLEVNQAALEYKVQKPLVLGVTILTSISESVLKDEIGCVKNLQEQVVSLALLAKKSGLDGVVASPKEVSLIRENCGDDFIILTPGIRPLWASANDQKRIMTPKDAIKKGSNYIVIGRPILNADSPREAALKIAEEIKQS